MGRGDLGGYGQTEIPESMFAFHFVSLVREVIAITGYAVSMCVREKVLKTQKYEHKKNKSLAYSMFLFQPLCLQGSFPFL